MSNTGTMVLIDVNGEITEMPIDAGKPDQLTTKVRDALGDYLELVPHFEVFDGRACVAFCGENGKLNQLAINEVATRIWHLQSSVKHGHDVLVGPVVILYGPPKFMRAL
jgi:hypothetical protein